jgi:hypothetical protein
VTFQLLGLELAAILRLHQCQALARHLHTAIRRSRDWVGLSPVTSEPSHRQCYTCSKDFEEKEPLITLFWLFDRLPTPLARNTMTRISIRATNFLLLIAISINCSFATELFEHKLDVDHWRDDAEFHFFPQMPLSPNLHGNESIEASGAGLFARGLLRKRQCPGGSRYCVCTAAISLKLKPD